MNLVGAPNTRKVRKAFNARSAAEAVRLVRQRKAATSAEDYGAINAYDDKDGNYRCTAYRWMRVVDDQTFSSLPKVRVWYATWLKKIAEKPAGESRHE